MNNVPENLEIVPKFRLIMVSAEEERSIHAVPHVLKFGRTVAPAHGKYTFSCRKELEFCFRLCSEEPYAEDEMDGVRYRNRFPHLFVKKPHVPYRYQVEAPRYAYFIIYPASALADFLSAGMSFEQPDIEFQINPEIKSMFAALRGYETSVHDRGNADRIDLLAFQLIMSVFLQKKTDGDEPDQTKKIRRIASLLEADPAAEWDFQEIAEKNGMSRRSFFRNWKKLYRISPAQFLIERKMNLAQHLLLSGTQPVNEISDLLGFSSPSYFIQAFRKRFQISPSLYRHSAGKQE